MITEQLLKNVLEKMPTLKPILVLGDIGIDQYTQGKVERISPEAPVPVIEVEKEWLKLGLAGNVSDNLIELGVTSQLIGLVGDDSFANTLEHLLEDRHIKTWGLLRCPGRKTTLKQRIVTSAQQICRVDHESLDPITDEEKIKLLDRLNELGVESTHVIIEDYGKGLIEGLDLPEVIKSLQDKGLYVAVDPSRKTRPTQYFGVDLLKPNKDEAFLMAKNLGFKGQSVEDLCLFLRDTLELKNLVVTLGAEGMAILEDGHNRVDRIQTRASEVFDVSGAGDTVISVMVSCIAQGVSLKESCHIANLAAGVVVGKKGTALVSPKELIGYFKHLQ